MDNNPKARPKLKDIPIEANDLDAVLNMSIRSIQLGRRAKFPETEQGLEDFKQCSIDYLEFVRTTNNNPANENRIIPDIEGWCAFMGTTRATILTYEKTRSEEWKEFILQVKNIITACKKQLAFRQKIPTLLAVFDLTNNSDYVNTSEFKLKPDTTENIKKALSAAELPKLGAMKANRDSELLPRLGGNAGENRNI